MYEQTEIIIQYMRNRFPMENIPDLVVPSFQSTQSIDMNELVFDLDASWYDTQLKQ